MGGIKKTVKSVIKDPVRGLGQGIGTVFTAGLNHTNLAGGKFKKIGDTVGDAFTLGGAGLANSRTSANLVNAQGQSPTELLAQSGGAPLLANVAMGVDPMESLAGYFGKSTKDGSWEQFQQTLSQKDFDAINSVYGQVKTIAENRDLRQKAVDKVVQDFPNIVQENAKTYGHMFDENMKQYVDQALQGTAAKYAAGGSLSSGAANEAFARVGAEQGLNRLNYSTENAVRDAGLRLNEVNALRDFQNTMLTGQVQQGFSAQQANLQRQFQGNMFNAEAANQKQLANQASKNAMFGAIGSLGGSLLGGSMLGALGGGAKTPKVNTPNYGGGGYGMGPGIDTQQYAPWSSGYGR